MDGENGSGAFGVKSPKVHASWLVQNNSKDRGIGVESEVSFSRNRSKEGYVKNEVTSDSKVAKRKTLWKVSKSLY